MLRLLNDQFFSILFFTLFVVSCGFIDLRPITYTIYPETGNCILENAYSPVSVTFDTEMIKTDAEKIFQVNSETGSLRGDYSWNGNTLYYTPIAGWTTGMRYTINFLGTARSVDGRELRVERFISFYAINKNEPPELLFYSPENGASIKTNETIFEFLFSHEMDRLSTESAIKIEGLQDKTIEWIDERTVQVKTKNLLSPWSNYKWNILESAKSKDGVPLVKAYSGYFTTDQDQELPYVLNAYPVLFDNGSWYPTGSDLERGLASGQGIAVIFNKPMSDNALNSVRFEPPLSGRAEWLSENGIVYIFSKDPDPETIYTLIVSSETKDSEGLKTGYDFKTIFYPDIPYINIFSILKNGGELIDYITPNMIIPVKTETATGEILLSVRFSLPFTTEEKINTAQRITLVPFFPKTLPPAAVKSINWLSDDCVFIRWEGLKPGNIDISHYYKLFIPGNKGGISNGHGMIMKNDMTIFLEAVNE